MDVGMARNNKWRSNGSRAIWGALALKRLRNYDLAELSPPLLAYTYFSEGRYSVHADYKIDIQRSSFRDDLVGFDLVSSR
ncbi:hypothetical protein M514_07169 [Trichuris suis]|uniref:Uncharacterized protein n=1 Tax=Trichuris suis TaxID=68888 RepID=A0A085NBY4_9BILA|nr:hypothetical protein M513_07169 [Trichuris suis]KFD66980.1 hypothetical protein M514_07169 [Trichuris suis]